jgi:hypothetical protein
MTEFEKLELELWWEPTRFYENFNQSSDSDGEYLRMLRMGLTRILATMDKRCDSIQDKTFKQMKECLRKELTFSRDAKKLESQLTDWIEYLTATKKSIRSETLKIIRLYLNDLIEELKQIANAE